MGKRTNTAAWLEKYNRWQIKVQKDGERRTFTSSTPGRNGQRECNQKADNWLDAGLINPETKTQIMFNKWLAELKLNTSKSHWRPYQSLWENWAAKKIGRKKIIDVTEQDLQDIINAAYKSGLSKKTLTNIRSCLRAFIKYCRKSKATILFVENVTIPKKAPTKERSILQPDDLEKLFSIDTTVIRGKTVYEPLVQAYRFEVSTGLRPGEVIGLMWEDINLDSGTVELKRSINKYNEVTDGKNENAQRNFSLTLMARAILNEHYEKSKQSGALDEHVFPGLYGGPVPQRTYYNRWIRYRDNTGISIATPYELRHTFVSIIKELPVGLIKPIVGHSINMDTYKTYGHEVDGEMEKTANLIEVEFRKIMPNKASGLNSGLNRKIKSQ